MTEIMESGITVEAMRRMVRAKIRDGISRREIALLIEAHAKPGADGGREDAEGERRPAIETIPAAQRAAFLAALNQL